MRTHSFFGALIPDADGGIDLTRMTRLGAHDVPLELHLTSCVETSDAALDALALLVQRSGELDRVARVAMESERDDSDSATASYEDLVHHHFPEGTDVVAALVPARLWTRLERDAEVWVVLDYAFDSAARNHVLSARFDASGRLISLEVES